MSHIFLILFLIKNSKYAIQCFFFIKMLVSWKFRSKNFEDTLGRLKIWKTSKHLKLQNIVCLISALLKE